MKEKLYIGYGFYIKRQASGKNLMFDLGTWKVGIVDYPAIDRAINLLRGLGLGSIPKMHLQRIPPPGSSVAQKHSQTTRRNRKLQGIQSISMCIATSAN